MKKITFLLALLISTSIVHAQCPTSWKPSLPTSFRQGDTLIHLNYYSSIGGSITALYRVSVNSGVKYDTLKTKTFDPNLYLPTGASQTVILEAQANCNGSNSIASAYVNIYRNTATFDSLPATICSQGQVLPLYKYAKYSGATPTYSGIGVSGNMFDPSKAPIGDVTITFKQTDPNKASITITRIIKVIAGPQVQFNMPSSVCSNALVFTMNATPSGGSYSGSGVTGNQFDPSYGIIGQNVVSYSYTSGSCTSTVNDTVVIKASPNKAYIKEITTTKTLRCSGIPMTLTVSNPNNLYAYTWYSDSLKTNKITTGLQLNTSPVEGQNVYWLETYYNQCSDNKKTIIDAAKTPNKPLISTTATTVCNGAPFNLIAKGDKNTNSNYKYENTWFDASMNELIRIDTFTVSNLRKPTSYYLTTINTANYGIYGTITCQSLASNIAIKVDSIANPILSYKSLICSGQIDTLKAQSLNNTIQWFDSLKNPIANGNMYIASQVTSSRTYYVRSSNANCSSDYSAASIKVVSIKASFTSTQTNSTSAVFVQFNSTSSMSADQYKWYFGDGFTSSMKSPGYSYTKPGKYSVSLVVSNSLSNCKDSIGKLDYIIYTATGIKEIVNQDNIKISPNPSSDSINLSFKSTTSDSYLILITDMLGKVAFYTNEHFTIGENVRDYDISKLAPGNYLLNITNQKEQFTQKIIKN